MRRMACALTLVALTALGGCTTYYEATVPATSAVYYTKKASVKEKKGLIQFKDQATGRIIYLDSVEFREITKEEFRANTGTD